MICTSFMTTATYFLKVPMTTDIKMKHSLIELRKYFTEHHIINVSGRLNCKREKYLETDSELRDVFDEYVSKFFSVREAFYCLKHNIDADNRPPLPDVRRSVEVYWKEI